MLLNRDNAQAADSREPVISQSLKKRDNAQAASYNQAVADL